MKFIRNIDRLFQIMYNIRLEKRRTRWGEFKMKKPLIVLLCVLVVVALVGVLAFVIYKHINRYDPDNFIGLSAEQIIDRYGEFDRCSYWDSTDHYRAGVYIVKPKRAGFLGTYNEEYFVIRFHENGVAYECEYVIGGAGG